MGNTVTKESGDFSRNGTHANGTVNETYNASAAGSRSHQWQEGETSPHRSSRHRHRSHHGQRPKHSRARREGYDMIIDPNETVDGGYLFPQGVYHGGQDYKVSVVRDMILRRKLAPFYKGLDSVEPDWTDEKLLEMVKCEVETASPPKAGLPGPPTKDQQIWLYSNTHECPICFLVYPRLNGTRCCGQDICTECFVQIKRNPPHPPYNGESTEAADVLDLLSEPAACPYCAQPNLGVIFEAPPFEWGLPAPSAQQSIPNPSTTSSSALLASTASLKGNSPASSTSSTNRTKSKIFSADPPNTITTSSLSSSSSNKQEQNNQQQPRKRRTSIPFTDPSVVTVDMIRPDWEEKLASARRRLARKSANARALHRSALLPRENGDSTSYSLNSDTHPTAAVRSYSLRDPVSLSEVLHNTRTMSSAQTRALEQKMIDDAIKASLAQQ